MSITTQLILDNQGVATLAEVDLVQAGSISITSDALDDFEIRRASVQIDESSATGRRELRFIVGTSVSIVHARNGGIETAVARPTQSAIGTFLRALGWITHNPPVDPPPTQASLSSGSEPDTWRATMYWRLEGEVIAQQTIVGATGPSWRLTDDGQTLDLDHYSMRETTEQLASFVMLTLPLIQLAT